MAPSHQLGFWQPGPDGEEERDDVQMADGNNLGSNYGGALNYEGGLYGGFPAAPNSQGNQGNTGYGGRQQFDTFITTPAAPGLSHPSPMVLGGRCPVYPAIHDSDITLALRNHSHSRPHGSQRILQSQFSAEIPSPVETNQQSGQPISNQPHDFHAATIISGDKRHHITACASRPGLCYMSAAMARSLQLGFLPIPSKMQKPMFTLIGLVTPTHYCSFRCDIEGLRVEGRELHVSLVESDDPKLFAYLHLSAKFLDSLRVQSPCEPGRSHAVHHHRRRRRSELAVSPSYAGFPAGAPRPMAFQAAAPQVQATVDPRSMHLPVPNFPLGRGSLGFAGTPTTVSSGVFSANIAGPTPGTSFGASDLFNFEGASSASVDARYERSSGISCCDEEANM
ncbi:Putative protein of unknown function [Podospora comata]|uniref:Uncharacterized protein n=1 Tax=Podospora comata TaxID=48703 RepID=A0ABY6SB53_PODCO|nr:Putative protein of unknown function [Podospora comata]